MLKNCNIGQEGHPLKCPASKSEKMFRFTYIGCRSTPPGFPPGPNPSPLLQVWNSRSDSDYLISNIRIAMTIKISRKKRPSWSGNWTKSSRSWSSHSPTSAAWPEDQVVGDSNNGEYVWLCSSFLYTSATQTTRPSTRPL